MSEFPGCCVWLTGLPAAGKTTIAKLLVNALQERGVPTDRLDGDVVRKSFCSDLGFTKADRDENVRRNGFVASYLSHSGKVAVAAFVSPYEEARGNVRALVKNMVEVYVRCPLEECEKRDHEDPNRAGLYAQARAGKISGFTGIDDPYEEPTRPEITLDTRQATPQECVENVLRFLTRSGLLTPLQEALRPQTSKICAGTSRTRG